MKNEDAGKVQCLICDRVCQGGGCMAWMSNKEGTEGQCAWMVTSNMFIKTMSVMLNPTMQGRIVT